MLSAIRSREVDSQGNDLLQLDDKSQLDAGRDFRRAIRARYFRAFLAPRPLAILAVGLLSNLLLHHWAFDILSERFGWYRSMAVIIFGMSVDFYLLCLVGLTHSTFEAYSQAGVFRDLHVAGVRAWHVMKPLLEVLILLIVADTAIEGLVAAVTGHEPFGLLVAGYAGTMLYAFIAGVFIGLLILGMNLMRVRGLGQYFTIILISFVTLYAVSQLADYWEPALRSSRASSSRASHIRRIVAYLSDVTSATPANFSVEYAYYAALMLEGTVLAILTLPMYQYVRRVAERRFALL